jgi:hypothetical protein
MLDQASPHLGIPFSPKLRGEITPIGLSRIPLSGSMMDTVPVIWHLQLHVGFTGPCNFGRHTATRRHNVEGADSDPAAVKHKRAHSPPMFPMGVPEASRRLTKLHETLAFGV